MPSYVVDGEYVLRPRAPAAHSLDPDGRRGPAPDVAYESSASARALAGAATSERLSVAVDFKSPHAYLAVEPTCALADALGIAIDWQPFLVSRPEALRAAGSPTTIAARGIAGFARSTRSETCGATPRPAGSRFGPRAETPTRRSPRSASRG